MGNKSVSVARRRRAKTWDRYYRSKDPDRTSEDWIHKECLNCGEELILEYKKRNQKFCNLSCSTSYRNKQKTAHKET